jgi:hypothetical protein
VVQIDCIHCDSPSSKQHQQNAGGGRGRKSLPKLKDEKAIDLITDESPSRKRGRLINPQGIIIFLGDFNEENRIFA